MFVRARAVAATAVLRSFFAFLSVVVAFTLLNVDSHAGELPQFLVVDYHPVSKQAAAGAGGQFDYVYRVDVRNSGTAAAALSGTVRARLPLLAVLDDSAAFGPVAAFQTKASVDTITVRAGRFFDRRLDKKVRVNGRWQYEEQGSDDNDRSIPGLPPFLGGWVDDIADRHYAIKFQFLFYWSFSDGADGAVPAIDKLLPAQPENNARPVISASYQDGAGGDGIDVRKVAMTLDGANVTAGATIRSGSIAYTPPRALRDGVHAVKLSVANRAGKTANADWTFLVDTREPVVSGQSPGRVTNASPTSVIGASYSDTNGSGIDLSGVTLRVDNVDVTSAALKSATGIGYTPPAKLSNGQHRVVLKVRDLAGNSTTEEWTFGVDGRGVAITGQAPARDSVLGADSRPTISAQFDGVGTEVVAAKTVLVVDGVDVTKQARISTTGISYTPAKVLAEGEHNVRLSVIDKRQSKTESSWNFTTRSLPEFGVLAPRDVVLNAQAVVKISAAYRDIGAGIDPAQTRITIDGVDFSAQARITETGLSLTPVPALPQGEHLVSLSVTDKAGNMAATTWRFTIDGALPVIQNPYPQDTVVTTATPAIGAAYADSGAQGSGIDPARVRLLIDGADVTRLAKVGANAIVYQPAAPMAAGLHTAVLRVADAAGNVVESVWSFRIDLEGPSIAAAVTPADASTLPADALPRISARYQDGAAGVDAARTVLELDGKNVTAQAQVGPAGIDYTPAQALAEGSHTVRLTVADQGGNTSVRSWTFVTASAPVISAVAPDGATLPAGAAPKISASYADIGAGIDTEKVVLRLDGQDATAQATVGAAGIEYLPAQALANGEHAVLLRVEDRAGNATERSWSFRLSSPPLISAQSPSEEYLPSGATPVIAASFSAAGSAIDPARVKLYLNGSEVSAQATVSASGVRYVPPAPLSDGTYHVRLVVVDVGGATAESSWRFGVASPPVISALTPKDTILPFGAKPKISVQFQSARPIERASLRVMVDSQDVTAQAVLGNGRVDYTPAQPLEAGPHTVYVALANASGATAEAFWGFDVDAETVYKLDILAPASGAITREPVISVSAATAGSTAAARSITVNGVEMAYESAGEGYRLAARVNLVPGENTLRVIATYNDGATRTATALVTYDAPPVVTITGPADKATLGAASTSSPRDLTGNVERPVTVTGTVSKPVASVTINQQAAELSADGRAFSFPNFFLHEGINLLSAVATDASGRTATASVTVTVDQTAPILNVEAPVRNAITSAAQIDVRGVVNDAVEGWTDVPYAVVTVTNGANGKSVVAKVSDRFYIAQDLALEIGANVLNVTARDHVGNSRQAEVAVTRIAAGSDRLTLLAGNRQRGALNAALPKPLAIVALARDGNPLANRSVTFDVLRGTGTISRSGAPLAPDAAPQRNLAVTTDAAGRAEVWLTLGKQSGEAGNVVRASATGIAEEVVFTATGEKGLPAWIRADAGVTQFGETGATSLEPLSAVVTDSEENRVPGVDVVFSVEQGDAAFIDASGVRAATLLVRTDKNGMATARPTYGAAAGTVRITAKAINPANQAEVVGASYQLTVLAQRDGPTRFSGKVLSHEGRALPGVRLSIGRTSLSTTADDQGNFSFTGQVPPGKIDLFVDGRTANVQTSQYPALHFEALAVRGQDNVLSHPIYLPPLLMSEAKIVGGDQDVTLRIPGFDGFEMVVKANSVTFPDGSRTGPLVVSPVHQDKLPMVPPGGYSGFMSPAWTIQPSGARFDPPIQVKVPNSLSLKPGETREIFQWDHDLATFVPMGRATVSEDGALLVSDAGSGLTKAGWGGPPNPPPDPPKCGVTSCQACQMKNPAGQAPCCVRDKSKDGQVVGSAGFKLAMEAPFKESVRSLTKFVGVEMELIAKGEIGGSMDDACCRHSEKGMPKGKYAFNGVLGFEGALAVPLLPILKKIPFTEFIPAADAFIPHSKLKIGISAGGSGEYDSCEKEGDASGKISLEVEVDALSLSNKGQYTFTRLDPANPTGTHELEITIIEVGGIGNGTGSLKEWNKSGMIGEYSAMASLFVRLPAISKGSFNFTLGEFSFPLMQGTYPFICPMLERGLGPCRRSND